MESIVWVLLSTFLVCIFVYVLIKIIKNERNRKSFINNVKVGDKVYTPSLSNEVKGEVLEIYEDSIVMKVTVSKNIVYPRSK